MWTGNPMYDDENPSYTRLPVHMQEAARLWVEYAASPGRFLFAVLNNNLVNAFNCADEKNLAEMRAWVSWLYNDIPGDCWGSKEKITAWKGTKPNSRRP
jgi:hypothetical protein